MIPVRGHSGKREETDGNDVRCVRAGIIAIAVMMMVLLAGVSLPAEAKSQKGLTLDALRSAPVPAMCGNKAGKLKNGKLVGVKSGYVKMAKKALGQLSGDKRHEAAVVLECARGNAPFPHVVAIYAPSSTGKAVLKGVVRLEKLGRSPGHVHTLAIKSAAVTVRWYDAGKYECRACATVSSQARVRLIKGKVRVDRVTRLGAGWAAKEYAKALNSYNHKKVVTMSADKSVTRAFERLRRNGRYTFVGCSSEQTDYKIYTCDYRQGAYVTSVDLEWRGWKNWKAIGGYAYH